jgi:hypothetical protein
MRSNEGTSSPTIICQNGLFKFRNSQPAEITIYLLWIFAVNRNNSIRAMDSARHCLEKEIIFLLFEKKLRLNTKHEQGATGTGNIKDIRFFQLL